MIKNNLGHIFFKIICKPLFGLQIIKKIVCPRLSVYFICEYFYHPKCNFELKS